MISSNFKNDLKIAKQAAKKSGKLLLDKRSLLNKNLESSSKDTKLLADIESEKLIKEILNSSSEYQILGEEGGKSDENLGDTYWVVDPLDGTANYNRGIPICCVSIGLIKNMKPILGVIYDFDNDDLYAGDISNSLSTKNDAPIKVSNYIDKADGVLITGLPHATDYSDESLKSMIKDMQTWKKIRMIGSAAMAACYVASGKAEMYMEKGIYLWDIVAGAAIVESAGGHAEILNIRDNFQVDVIFSNSKIK
tara:strand:+ start:651 stop:1403 length:753 start_codon:yes stop_codon:yes gene_type:complete